MGNYLGFLGVHGALFTGPLGAAIFTIILVWSIAWKGFALWRAARERSIIWFVVFMVVNTLGVLEIIYLFFFSKAARESRAWNKYGPSSSLGRDDSNDRNDDTEDGEVIYAESEVVYKEEPASRE